VPLCGKLEHRDGSLCLQKAPGSQLRITAYKKARRKDWVRNLSTLIQLCCLISYQLEYRNDGHGLLQQPVCGIVSLGNVYLAYKMSDDHKIQWCSRRALGGATLDDHRPGHLLPPLNRSQCATSLFVTHSCRLTLDLSQNTTL